MTTKESQDKLKEPFSAYGSYSYSDYLSWQVDGMVELIRGKVHKMTAAPSRKHQDISLKISSQLFQLLTGKVCKVYEAPFDVRLPGKAKDNMDIHTVVQPDICVICDRSKLDDAGCIGAPDLIVEILSPGNNQKDLQHKYDVYEENGVREYWIIHPEEQTLLVYTLRDERFVPSKLFTVGEKVASSCLPDFCLDLEELFDQLD
ncbi:Uma2 family endonuclease [Cyclobacterium jeungdonense]|uniref:Uma2 family endonuclease n=1 Tax=Cyclobacterium jeungdonense TaxID=708087 RepID=A0ABT8C7J9_9BACT|nr:Uma2 family endonuclease [Cyclobacterium jeungdonense]MDN3688356.1 Uma2 family endonuclease [Cyclobacterium jeungdonense]